MVQNPRLSIIIPALNEAATIGELLGDLTALDVEKEVIVVDGGSADGTAEVAARLGARVIHAPRGRGAQLARGAESAHGALFCFLHADVRMNAVAAGELARALATGAPGPFVFRLRIGARGAAYRLVEAGAAVRSRLFRLPYGDQGLVVSREDYQRAGGYPHWPLMEDVALVRSIRRHTRLTTLPASLEVSARRWRRDGVLRRSARNLLLLARFLTGSTPSDLAARYDSMSTGRG